MRLSGPFLPEFGPFASLTCAAQLLLSWRHTDMWDPHVITSLLRRNRTRGRRSFNRAFILAVANGAESARTRPNGAQTAEDPHSIRAGACSGATSGSPLTL